ncbi:hypothetical protein BGX38DRAFT_1102135 [Terfezia claveryi]|nr:hypothetical protein BGX38DRAFT_1102135 [Terfezia claveryi]
MLWEPVKLFNSDNERIYSELNTGSWWWDQQKQVPVGYTVVPVLLASDQTHFTNFSGDKKLWLLYMSIGYIKSTIRNKPTMNTWIPIALLPIPLKRLNRIPGHPVEAQELDALQVSHGILSSILSPLADARIQQGTEMVCCDEKVRNCMPRLSA